MPLHLRQGDLLLVRLDTWLAVTLAARQSDSIVAGEATGHTYCLQADTILEAPDGAHSLDITFTTQVVRAEQRRLTLKPSCWLVVRQRECAPEAIRRVAD